MFRKAILLLQLFVLTAPAAFAGEPGFIHLITHQDGLKSQSEEQFSLPYTRIAAIELHPKLWQKNGIKTGDQLQIDLFDKASLQAIVDRVQVDVNGTASVRARIEGDNMGYLLISISGNLVLGTLSIPERNERYSLKTNPISGITYLKLLDQPALDHLDDAPSPIPPGIPEFDKNQLQGLLEAAEKNTTLPASIDVMIVYTPAARVWANAQENTILNTISQAMGKAQLALDNSQTGITMNLVHSAEINYTESGDSPTDLRRLTFHEGYDPWDYEGTPRYMEEVHDWRAAYGADLVALFTEVTDVGGIGWLLNYQSGFPQLGFSITRVQQASWSYTLIHEMGHNMGAHHHKEQNVQPGPTTWQDWSANTWSAGWRWQGSDGNLYCDLMTYNSGQYFADGQDAFRTPYFSSPLVGYMGAPTGHSADGDNARTLREVKHVVAAYMGTVDPVCEPVLLSFYEPFEPTTVHPCWDQTVSEGINANRWSFSDTEYAGGQAMEKMATWADGTGVSRMISPPIDLTAAQSPVLHFRQFLDDYGPGCTFKIQSSSDGIAWTDEATLFVSGGGNIGPQTMSIPISARSSTTYLAWVIDGNHYQFDFWYIDDVVVEETQVASVPDNRNLSNETIGLGEETCFDALLTLTTGGDGPFVVESGAVVSLIAGEKIIMLPGTRLESGSQVLAYITTDGTFCSEKEPLADEEEEELIAEDIADPEAAADSVVVAGLEVAVNPSLISSDASFRVYPNPTGGQFTLELQGYAPGEEAIVGVYGLRGETILRKEIPTDHSMHTLSLEGHPPGIYLIRVVSGNHVGVERIMKR
jgi:hypothetical protein